MELKEILQEYKQTAQKSNTEIALLTGVSKSSVSKWLSGASKRVKPELLDRISDMVGYDVKPLLQGNIVQFKKPILGSVKAGYDMYAQSTHLGYEEVTIQERKSGDYFLQVEGDSMLGDGIVSGSLAYIKRCNYVNNKDIAIVCVGEEVTMKRVLYKADMLILQASNPQVETRYFTKEEVETLPITILGKVVYVKQYF